MSRHSRVIYNYLMPYSNNSLLITLLEYKELDNYNNKSYHFSSTENVPSTFHLPEEFTMPILYIGKPWF